MNLKSNLRQYRKSAAILAVSCICVFSANAAELTLVREGKPEAVIVLSEKPTRAAQLGAFELQHHIKLITGVELQIVRGSVPEKNIKLMVGENNAGLTGEISAVRFEENKIFLTGNDSPDYGAVRYDAPHTFPKLEYNYRGSLYAVYDFLEIHCGVRFYGPDESGTTYQERKTLTVNTALERRHKPPMDAFRLISFSYSQRDYLLLKLRWRNTVLFGQCNHNMYSIFFRYWDRAQKKYSVPTAHADVFIEKRPWYFAQGYKGKNAPVDPLIHDNYPNDADIPPQVCFSQPDVVKYYAEEAVAYFKGGNVVGAWGNLVGAKPTSETLLPRMDGKPFFYPVQGGDTGGGCKCEKCLSRYQDIPEAQRYSNLYFQFISDVAREAEKIQPGTGISSLAYISTLNYPKSVKIPDNVSVTMCLPISSWWHPALRDYQQKIYNEWIKNEAKKRPMGVWLYLFGPAWDGIRFKYKPFPGLYPWKAGEIVKGIVNDGVRGMFAEVLFNHNFLEAYVTSRLCYDPSVPPEKIIDEYFENYYGAAGATMKEFYHELENIYWDQSNYPKGWFASKQVIGPSGVSDPTWSASGFHSPDINWSLGTPERLFRLNSILDKAAQLAKTPVEKQRLQRLMNDVWLPALQGRKDFDERSKIRNAPQVTAKVPLISNIAGDLTKVDWNAAQVLESWKSLDGKELKDSPVIRMICDKEFLYLKYNEEGLIDPDSEIWNNNVELFFTSSGSLPVYQFAISPHGRIEQNIHRIIHDVRSVSKHDFNATLKNLPKKENWSWELAIPLSKLPPFSTEAGGSLSVNFFRTKKQEGVASWSPIYGKAYMEGLERFGRLYLPFPVNYDVNGQFKSEDSILPDFWITNKNKDYAPYGAVVLIDQNESKAVRITSNQAPTPFYCRKLLPVNGGDTVTLEFDASGNKGTAIAGIYFYSDFSGNGFVSVAQQSFELQKEMKPCKLTFKIPEQINGKKIYSYRMMITAPPLTELIFSKPSTQIIRD